MDNYGINKTILLVDDDTDFCFLMTLLLRKQGFKVITAHTLVSAEKELIACDPNIILLDHHMPDGLGTEFIKINQFQLKGRYVIYISGEQNSVLKSELDLLDVFEFLPKPFHPSALNKIIYLAATLN